MSPENKSTLGQIKKIMGRFRRLSFELDNDPDQRAISQVRSLVETFSQTSEQIPVKTLKAEGQNSIDLTKEPDGTIFRLRIDKRHSGIGSESDDFVPLFFVSTKVDGAWYFIQFYSDKSEGRRQEFHVKPEYKSSIKYALLKFETTDFNISETDQTLPFLKFFESPAKGIDIMVFGNSSKGGLKRDPNSAPALSRSMSPKPA